jgi:hypothetical protein
MLHGLQHMYCFIHLSLYDRTVGYQSAAVCANATCNCFKHAVMLPNAVSTQGHVNHGLYKNAWTAMAGDLTLSCPAMHMHEMLAMHTFLSWHTTKTSDATYKLLTLHT